MRLYSGTSPYQLVAYGPKIRGCNKGGCFITRVYILLFIEMGMHEIMSLSRWL